MNVDKDGACAAAPFDTTQSRVGALHAALPPHDPHSFPARHFPAPPRPADVNFDELARSTDDFNAAMLKAVCVEAGMLALRHDRPIMRHEDFVSAINEVQAKKKTSLQYYA